MSSADLNQDSAALSAGRYRIAETIGGGSVSTVYRATCVDGAPDVALKVLHAWLDDPQRAAHRLFREAKLIAQLDHPGCVRLLDWGVEKKRPFLVLELVEGVTLDVALERRGRFDDDEIIAIGVQICDVLEAAHDLGIVHRDLKPDNIMFHESVHGLHVKVLDFGIARLLPQPGDDERTQPRELTLPGSLLGSPTHLAPEQVLGGSADKRSDIYALGVVLYELASGRLPIVGASAVATVLMIASVIPEPLRRHCTDMHSGLERAVMRCLEKRPDDRWSSAVELREALVSAAEDGEFGQTIEMRAPLVQTQKFAIEDETTVIMDDESEE